MSLLRQKTLAIFVVVAVLLVLFVLLRIETPQPIATQQDQVYNPIGQTNNTYQAADGKTIIKDAVPPSLQQIEAELNSINQDLDRDFAQLKADDELALSGQAGIAENAIAQAEAILALVAKEGVDNQAIEVAFNKIVDAPITAEKPLKVKKQLDRIDSDIIDIEADMLNLALDRPTESDNASNTQTNTSTLEQPNEN